MSDEPIIVIPGPLDPRLGYLNKSNIHFPFVLENKTWPTIEHFILAKRFEGTTLEEEIRKSKNIYKARILAKPSRIIIEEDGRIIKKIVYGSSNQGWCTLREDWGSTKELEYLEMATRSKFFQNKKAMTRLIKTEGIHIIDPESETIKTGPVLEKIRDEYLEKIRSKENKKKQARKIGAPYADIRSRILSEEEQNLIVAMLSTVNILKNIESIPENTPATMEMIEDVFYNFSGDVRGESLSNGEEIISVIRGWATERSSNWTEVARNMPNYEALMRDVENIIKTSPIGATTSATTRVKIAIFIASLIRWLRMDASSVERSTFFSRSKIIKKENFILPPLRRSYRVYAVPPSGEVSSKSKNADPGIVETKSRKNDIPRAVLRGARYIEIFRKTHNLDPQTFSNVVTYLEKMPRGERSKWLKDFEKLDVVTQKEKLQPIISKFSDSKKNV